LLGPNEQCECAYGNVAEPETATLYQREPNINDKMSLEDKIAEYQVYYQKGRYDVTMAGDKVLDEIAKILVANPNLKLQILGHLDNDEADDPKYKDISLKRAEFILNQMVNKSLDASRFTIADKKNIVGSPYIMDYDEDKTKTAKNRRVTFKIVE
jgi:outer membrane protein OmpA-like peptidoglycan-associated protein